MLLLYEPARDKTKKTACAPSEDSDQPGHSPSLIRVFAVRIMKVWVLSDPLSAQQRLWSYWADTQTDLSLRWAHMPICWFCHALAHIYLQIAKIQLILWCKSESQRLTTCLLTCASNDDSNLMHSPRSLISFVIRMQKLWLFGYPNCGDSNQTTQMCRLIRNLSLDAHVRK